MSNEAIRTKGRMEGHYYIEYIKDKYNMKI